MTPQQFIAMPREDQMRIAMVFAEQARVGQRLVHGPEDLMEISDDPVKGVGFGEATSTFQTNASEGDND